MDPDVQMIAVDTETAALVRKRAGEQGLTASEFIAALVQRDKYFDEADARELEHRWNGIAGGRETVPNDKVRQWLETWGTSDFKPWSGSR